jgi:hypothetical protein
MDRDVTGEPEYDWGLGCCAKSRLTVEVEGIARGLPHWHGKCYYLLFVWLA